MNAINTITLLVLMVMLTITIITTVHYARQAHDLDCELEACTTTIAKWIEWGQTADDLISDLQDELSLLDSDRFYAQQDAQMWAEYSQELERLIVRMSNWSETSEDMHFVNTLKGSEPPF